MTTALLSHAACLRHQTPPGHPERSERLRAVATALAAPEFGGLLREAAPEATRAQLCLAHPEAYVDAIDQAAPETGMVQLDGDTSMSPGSREAAGRAAGAVCRAVDLVLQGRCDNAFCAVRPPGHHAERARAMGFCLFANAVIGALHGRDKHGVRRIAILDFDVHHGNGTQDLVAADAEILFASSHQMPLFPGTGAAAETGVGNVVNRPLAPHAGSADFRAAWSEGILPRVEAFRPGLVIVSAGFDAHARDPLAQLRLGEADFAWVTREILAVAGRVAAGRVVSTLEGGYDLDALAGSVAAHVRELLAAGGRGRQAGMGDAG